MRPAWSELERPRLADLIWQRSQRRLASDVLGPHFEQVGAGFTPDLLELATADPQVHLVGLDRIYGNR